MPRIDVDYGDHHATTCEFRIASISKADPRFPTTLGEQSLSDVVNTATGRKPVTAKEGMP